MDIEDSVQLIDYLQVSDRIDKAETPITITLAGGVSNRTVLVQRTSGPDWVIKQALEKLRVATDWFSSPRRIEREALGIHWLGQLAFPMCIPGLVFVDFGNDLLCMEAVPQPHDNWKALLLAGNIHQAHVRQFAQLLGTIHSASAKKFEPLATLFADRSFFETLRLEPYYAYTATQVPESALFYQQLIQRTRQTQCCLVHGDFSPKNILVYRDQLILLDHEVIHWGDPSFDVGFALTHLLSKAHHLPECQTQFIQAANNFWQIYQIAVRGSDLGNDLEFRVVQQTLGCLLARVAGRSPLEYLGLAERQYQSHAVLRLMQHSPNTVADLVQAFIDYVRS